MIVGVHQHKGIIFGCLLSVEEMFRCGTSSMSSWGLCSKLSGGNSVALPQTRKMWGRDYTQACGAYHSLQRDSGWDS